MSVDVSGGFPVVNVSIVAPPMQTQTGVSRNRDCDQAFAMLKDDSRMMRNSRPLLTTYWDLMLSSLKGSG